METKSANRETAKTRAVRPDGSLVIRMFSRRPDTVRWETRLTGEGSLLLTVMGPGVLRRVIPFESAPELVAYQVDRQHQLLAGGYSVLEDTERRVGGDRRAHRRLGADRRVRHD